MSSIDTVIIGAGQAGLALSRLLTDAGHDHVVLERRRVGERWRSERWTRSRCSRPIRRTGCRTTMSRTIRTRSRRFSSSWRRLQRSRGPSALRFMSTRPRPRSSAPRGLPRAHRPRRMAGAQRRGRFGRTAPCRRCRGSPPRRRRRSSSCPRLAIARRRCWHRAACWWSAPARVVTRSPTSSRAQGAAWRSPWAATRASSSLPRPRHRAWLDALGELSRRWTTCRVRRAAGRGPPCRSTAEGGRTLDLGVLADAGVRIAGASRLRRQPRAAGIRVGGEHRGRRRASPPPARPHR